MTASPPPLPTRSPRTLLVHFGIDTAVAFLALVLVGLIVGVPLLAIAGVAIVAGAVAAPYTRRAEVRALDARQAGSADPA